VDVVSSLRVDIIMRFEAFIENMFFARAEYCDEHTEGHGVSFCEQEAKSNATRSAVIRVFIQLFSFFRCESTAKRDWENTFSTLEF
jgi:hypothetical protein